MTPIPADAGSALRLRVTVSAADPATARRLAQLVAQSGHQAVAATEPADAVLTDCTAAVAGGQPIVALGGAEDDFAGLLPKDAGPAQLDAALRAVAAGLIVRPPSPPQPGFAALPEAPSPPLTPREIEVLTALAAGLGNKAVARRLGISPHTVKFHIESLFRKLGAATRAEAVATGLRRQLVEF
jgi:DNA-binding CsgD family transcriptional regulator